MSESTGDGCGLTSMVAPRWEISDAATRSVLALIHGDPLHERDRNAVVTAILAAGRSDGGLVDPNQVRRRLAQSVYPRVVGCTYMALRRVGVLQSAGWTISDDKVGRNTGKPARTYVLAGRWLA